jgi:hypothetical protein
MSFNLVTILRETARERPDQPCLVVEDAEDMAAAAIFLAARSGDYVVGETLVVDGGVVHAGLGPEAERTGARKFQQRKQGG